MLTGAINGQNGLAPDEAERERGLKALRQENFEVIVRYAMRHARPGARRLLDVGSAHGWFLEIARKQFQVLGIEPDEAVGKRAAARGLPVRTGYFPDALADGERFDIIVFNDVIEHIPDIHSALASCHERLDEGGILILNIPSSRGFFYRLSKLLARVGWRAPFERLWQKDLPSPHVHYFNPGNLRQLVAGQGFELADATELPALRAQGLLERMRCTGDMGPVMLYAQYLAILCLIPVLRMFPSDIIVGVFRKKAAD
ncbi:bifunctional 2-polyprenyl-6-hydroxyphenol methylase/3-demethylubiquinol 3-O-methyltransferase UbiG [Massilia sp. KIM]|uniref:class I SAM-dependent methyltransferase n=1 Tax=Massilia sp. KIM TaxID=1955422 RepID=UPI001E306BC7|nr:class I SAM-dependent methyltransferase [Massilia sp. KIM]